MWQELQAVRAEISGLEEEKSHISDTVKALVVSNEYDSTLTCFLDVRCCLYYLILRYEVVQVIVT